jgi:REP element-mobilizing transposase RayT
MGTPCFSCIVSAMSRVLRAQQPGCPFHITARTQGKEPWFTDELKPHIAQTIVAGIRSAGALPLAFAVMSNHIHIVTVQGPRTLGWTMQPILRRIALMVKRQYRRQNQKHDGHVFGRRFFSVRCADALHLRTAILYTHYNPVKAGMCSDINAYAWTSHRALALEEPSPENVATVEALGIFAHQAGLSLAELRNCYMRHIEWWCAKSEAESRGAECDLGQPPAAEGDELFDQTYARGSAHVQSLTVDLRNRAHRILQAIAPGFDIELVRRPYGNRISVKVRRQLIAALLTSGYRGTAIADYLRVSEATISRVSSELRWGPPSIR